jgi:hypothetical protein
MAKDDVSTLHYYVKSIGGKYRQANFLRVFKIPDSVTSHADRNLIKNLLELEMCVALRTLPKGELVQWLPPGDREVKFPSVHLNIANPLFQDSFASANARQSSRDLLLDSADPEVRHWPYIRKKQLASEPKQSGTKFPYLPLAAYAPIFNEAVKANAGKLSELEPFNSDLEVPFDENFWQGGGLQKCEDAISQHLSREVPLEKPLGSLTSRIAIILSGVETFRSDKRLVVSPTPGNHDEAIPYGIREMGLNAGNTLIWPFNLGQSRISRPDKMPIEAAAIEATYFRDYSLSLIAASSARFILICDEIEQRYLFDEAQGLSPPIEINLRGYNVVFRLMLDGAQIQRVFVVIPDPRKIISGGDWRSRQKFAQVIRLATILTKMDAIDYNFFENHLAHECIFRALAEERTSGTPLEIDQLDFGTRQWLGHKGFQTDEDIEELTTLVGSLAEGLFVLLCSLPQRAKGEVGHARSRKKGVARVHRYSRELFTAVRKLREEKVQKNFIYPDLEEDGHEKVPVIAQISVSRQLSYQPTDGREGPKDPDEESEPLRTMEISLDIADEPKITITEVYDTIDSQQPDDSKIAAGKKIHRFTQRFLHKLYNGGLFNSHKETGRKAYAIAIHPNIRILVPTWIDLDQKRGAIVKAELADRGTKLSSKNIRQE